MDAPLTGTLARLISMRHLPVCEASERLSSFRCAGEELFLTQLAVSMQVKKLEGSVGLPLTEQAGKRIMRERSSGTRVATEIYFSTYALKLHVQMELGSNEAIKDTISSGLGAALLSQHTLRPGSDQAGLTIPDVHGFPIPWQWHVGYMRGDDCRSLHLLALKFYVAKSVRNYRLFITVSCQGNQVVYC